MRWGMALALSAVLCSTSLAQSLEEKLAKKLKSPFIQNAAWELDYDAALQKAKEQKKLVFAYFSRSFAP